MNLRRTTLVLGVDGSPAAAHCLELLLGCRGGGDRLELLLVNVQRRPVSLWPGAGIDPGVLDAALVEAGRAALKPALARLQGAGFTPGSAVCLGFPAPALLAEARSHGAEAIVVGTRGSGALHGFALGSVAMRVAHAGEVPVIIVRPDARLPARLGEGLRVLCAMDGSAPALRAVDRILAWQGWTGPVDAHLVHVREPLTLAEAIVPPHGDVIRHWSGVETENATREARERLERAGRPHALHAAEGDPVTEILRLAQETSSELIVLGTRGRGATHHALVGSVALRVAAASPVPVLLVS